MINYENIKCVFATASTNSEVYSALRLTMKKTYTALDRLVKAEFEFNGKNQIIRSGSLSGEDIQKVDAAVKGILYLHSASPLWEGRRATGSIKEKVELIADFNVALNEAIAMAM